MYKHSAGSPLVSIAQASSVRGRELPNRVLVIVPALNEQDTVGSVVRELRAGASGLDILIVDDGSTDATRQRALEAGVPVLSLPYNLGVGGAMRAGYKYAVRHGYDAAVQLDGDGQHDAAMVPALVAGLSHADIVIGARFAGADEYSVQGPRRWAMVCLAQTLSRILDSELTDATSGFRACNRKAMCLFAEHYPVEYLGDTVEALLIAGRSGLRVAQVPVTMRARTAGRPSAGNLRSSMYLARATFALCLGLIRQWPTTLPPDNPSRPVEQVTR